MKKSTLNKTINFEDSLFIIQGRIQMLYDILALDVSSDLFLDKTIDDMEFIDKTLETLIKTLTEDTAVEDRDAQFDNLSETEWQFSQALVRFLNVSGSISATHFPNLRDKIAVLRNQSAARRKIADDSQSKKEEPSKNPLVSSTEMSELLKGF
jgi:hypothetical protein